MKKVFLLFICCFWGCLSVFAQKNKTEKFEVAVGYAPTFWGYVDDGINKKYDVNLYFVYRHIVSSNFSIGSKIDCKAGPCAYNSMDNKKYVGFMHTYGVLAVADYCFIPEGQVNPFIGCATGPAFEMSKWSSGLTMRNNFVYIINPILGIECFAHLRFAMGIDIPIVDWEPAHMPVYFSVGWVF